MFSEKTEVAKFITFIKLSGLNKCNEEEFINLFSHFKIG